MAAWWWLMTTVGSGGGHDDHDGCAKNHCHGIKRDGSGDLCHQAAGWGTKHVGVGNCKLHLGNSPSHKTAAKIEIARQAAATYGLPVEIHPAQALLEEVQRTAGHVAWLGAIIAGMQQSDLVWGVVEETDRPFGENGSGGVETKSKAVPSVWLNLYQAERKHLAAVARDALGADAAGRVAAVFEQIGGTFVAMFERAMDQADLNAGQRAAIAGALMTELQALPDGGR